MPPTLKHRAPVQRVPGIDRFVFVNEVPNHSTSLSLSAQFSSRFSLFSMSLSLELFIFVFILILFFVINYLLFCHSRYLVSTLSRPA